MRQNKEEIDPASLALTVPISPSHNCARAMEPLDFQDITDAPVRILLVGLGFHAARTYGKHINELRAKGRNVRIGAIVDTTDAATVVTTRLQKLGETAKLHLVESFTGPMPATVEIILNRLVEMYKINAVIVATIPEVHAAYFDWALRSNLSVMGDKPFSSRHGAIYNIDAARGIAADMHSALAEYKRAKRRAKQQGKRVCALLNVQRRHHPAYRFIANKIAEVADRTGVGVSFISGHHEDGQFRLPGELIEISYHGYNGGNGKTSHSGVHVLDMTYWFLKAGWRPHNQPDLSRINSVFVQPCALLTQIPNRFYTDSFGKDWQSVTSFSEADLRGVAGRLGEMDASITIEFERDREVIGQALVSLLHNSVSQRSWLAPRADLYKQQGRIKGERWQIVSGPVQSISVEVRQADDQHDSEGIKSFEFGGPNHMQISVTRNAGVMGGKKIEVLQGYELGNFDNERLHVEQVKMAALVELVDFVSGRISHDDLVSDLSDHLTTACWMAAAYQSHVSRMLRRNRFVTVKL